MLSAAADALRAATAQLAPTSPTPRLDAELLMAHALDMARTDLLLRLPDLAEPTEFAALLARRAAQEPIAYIVGHQDFWDMTLDVTPDVLIPRADSETLIEAAQDMLADRPPHRIADFGTGSGALLLAALRLPAPPSAHPPIRSAAGGSAGAGWSSRLMPILTNFTLLSSALSADYPTDS